jgi:hypothetical protein
MGNKIINKPKKRHKWDSNPIETGEKAKCTKCGIIKESFGWVGGYAYYFSEYDFFFDETTSCGEEITKEMIKNARKKIIKGI